MRCSCHFLAKLFSRFLNICSSLVYFITKTRQNKKIKRVLFSIWLQRYAALSRILKIESDANRTCLEDILHVPHVSLASGHKHIFHFFGTQEHVVSRTRLPLASFLRRREPGAARRGRETATDRSTSGILLLFCFVSFLFIWAHYLISPDHRLLTRVLAMGPKKKHKRRGPTESTWMDADSPLPRRL